VLFCICAFGAATYGEEHVEQKYKDITFIFGPAGPQDLKDKIAGWARESQKTEVEVYAEYLEYLLTKAVENDKHLMDDVFSQVLREDIKVNNYFITEFMQPDKETGEMTKSPMVIVYPDQMSDIDGNPLDKVITKDMVDVAGSMFGYILKTNWVRTYMVLREEQPATDP
jgi:hypothetical protein